MSLLQKGILYVFFSISFLVGYAVHDRAVDSDQDFANSDEITRLAERIIALYHQNADSALSIFLDIASNDSLATYQVGASIVQHARSAEDDSIFVLFSYELGHALLSWGNFEVSKSYFDSLINYAQAKGIAEGISYGYKGLGDVAHESLQLEEAIRYFSLAEQGWLETANFKRLGYLYNNMGVVYRKQGNNYRALRYYVDAVEMLKKVDDARALAYISNNIGNIYLDQKKYDKAYEYHALALIYGQEIADNRITAFAYNNLGLIYDHQGESENALTYFKKGLVISLAGVDKEAVILSLTNVGESYLDRRQYDSALYYLQLALVKSKETNDVESETFALIGLGKVYTEIGRYRLATDHLEKGLRLADQAGQATNILEASKWLARVEENGGNFRRALELERHAQAISDSLKEIEINNNIALLQAEYEFKSEQEKNEAKIQLLTSQNQVQELELDRRKMWLWIAAIIFLVTGIISYLIYKQRLFRKEKEANELKQRLLRVQLNPHFMFNSLNAIQNMVFNDVDRHKTADYLARFSQLTRQILELNQHDLILLREELQFIRNYLSVQQIRFDQPFQYCIEIDEDLEDDSIRLPPMITQPFLENAIEHGIIDKSGEGEIIIQIREISEASLEITITDNGVGREQAAIASHHKQHRSMATEITRKRLDQLGKQYKSKTEMEITDLHDGTLVTGTKVRFRLPLLLTL